MKFEATENDMKEYSAIIQRIAYLDYEKNQLMAKLSEWEQAHRIEEPDGEVIPEQ